jgi:hypothetical protein
MGTAAQLFWLGSSGSLLVPRSSGTTANPSARVGMTGGYYTVQKLMTSPPIVSSEEKEWASLLASERQGLAKRRVKARAVDKAMKEVRYGK